MLVLMSGVYLALNVTYFLLNLIFIESLPVYINKMIQIVVFIVCLTFCFAYLGSCSRELAHFRNLIY